MHSVIKIVLIALAFIAFSEGTGAYNQAKAITHQIYAGIWFIVFAVSLGSVGIISALTKDVGILAKLNEYFQRITSIASANQADTGEAEQAPAPEQEKATQEKPQQIHEQKRETTRECPYCGADNLMDAKSCGACTRILKDYVPCPKCNADISHRPAECPGCGSQITWRNASDITK